MSINVSQSALKDFISCSEKVYYRIFVDGVSVPTKEMLMGTITHKVLEKAWQDKDVALNLGKTLCQKEGLDLPSQQAVEHFIHTFFERFKIMVDKGDKIEKRFKVKLWEDVYLVGVFDRISRGLVIDWKTDVRPPTNIDNSIQFIIYDEAYSRMFGKEPEGLYLAALKDGSLVRYNENPFYTDVVMHDLIPSFVDAVRNKKFVKTGIFNGACYRCPYKKPCLDGE